MNEFIYCAKTRMFFSFEEAKEVLGLHPIELAVHPGYIYVPWVGCN